MVAFEKVLEGIVKYIDREIFPQPNMNEWQEVLARIAVSRIYGNREALKTKLINNSFIRTFGVIDDEGMVDIDSLAEDLKKQIEEKGKLTVSIPVLGKLTFKASDVDVLRNTIKERG